MLKPEAEDRSKILCALIKAGFWVEQKDNLLLIKCPRYTVTCFYSEEFEQWRLTPYDQRAHQIVREAVE